MTRHRQTTRPGDRGRGRVVDYYKERAETVRPAPMPVYHDTAGPRTDLGPNLLEQQTILAALKELTYLIEDISSTGLIRAFNEVLRGRILRVKIANRVIEFTLTDHWENKVYGLSADQPGQLGSMEWEHSSAGRFIFDKELELTERNVTEALIKIESYALKGNIY